MKRTVVLIILDGWGLGVQDDSNPIHAAHLSTLSELEKTYPVTSLQASGISVGLPWGETGNSEVGHLTLGAGRVLYQHYPRITLSIQDKTFFSNQTLLSAFDHAKKNKSALNLVGLLTKGHTHASIEHLHALLAMAKEQGVTNIKLHLFADGKDGVPGSITGLLKEIPLELLSTLTGRYYGMDREGNWRLTQAAYDAMTGSSLPITQDVNSAIEAIIKTNHSEEFLPACRLREDSAIADNDAMIFFNFREDSIRQISEAFIKPAFNQFPVKPFSNLRIVTMTRYEEPSLVPVAFPPESLAHTLGQVLSDASKVQLRIAETYKYAHITYFFNGLTEPTLKNEYRVLIPSLQTPRIHEYPAMMASAITDRLVQGIENEGFDFILANYANPDTIGHTGNYEAAIEAVKAVDAQIARVIKTAQKSSTLVIITSDHGNVERVFDPITGRPDTQHDPNPVPFYLIAPEFAGRSFLTSGSAMYTETGGSLADVAPTILELMELPKPNEMTGGSLLASLL